MGLMNLFSRRQSSPAPAPRAAILNFIGDTANELVEADMVFLRSLFGEVRVAREAAPQCDILFLYANLASDGAISGSTALLREIIRDSAAAIVVVGSANTTESYINATKQKAFGRTNLVMTLNRNGSAFARFFEALFSRMKNGDTMPDAWVALSPQVPGRQTVDVPSTIFACELGPVRFRR